MITYFKEKRAERKVKLMFYKTIAEMIDSKKDILDFIAKTYNVLKDVPTDKLREELISKVAELIHSENK